MDLIPLQYGPRVRAIPAQLAGKLREPVSGLIHFIGVLMSAMAMVILLDSCTNVFNLLHVISSISFGFGMVVIYSASTLYHWANSTKEGLKILRRLDQISIFIGIGGTYTPLCLIPLRGAVGWGLFLFVWGVAVFGIKRKSSGVEDPEWITTTVYLVLGWLVVMALPLLSRTLSAGALFWLFGGGVFYTVGAVIDVMRRPNPRPGTFGYHEIFHVLVLLGSICHFWLVYRYLLPMD
jgi:hemolysin III